MQFVFLSETTMQWFLYVHSGAVDHKSKNISTTARWNGKLNNQNNKSKQVY